MAVRLAWQCSACLAMRVALRFSRWRCVQLSIACSAAVCSAAVRSAWQSVWWFARRRCSQRGHACCAGVRSAVVRSARQSVRRCGLLGVRPAAPRWTLPRGRQRSAGCSRGHRTCPRHARAMPAPRPRHPSPKWSIARATPAPLSCDPRNLGAWPAPRGSLQSRDALSTALAGWCSWADRAWSSIVTSPEKKLGFWPTDLKKKTGADFWGIYRPVKKKLADLQKNTGAECRGFWPTDLNKKTGAGFWECYRPEETGRPEGKKTGADFAAQP
eukprot:gene12049-biopygen18450